MTCQENCSQTIVALTQENYELNIEATELCNKILYLSKKLCKAKKQIRNLKINKRYLMSLLPTQ